MLFISALCYSQWDMSMGKSESEKQKAQSDKQQRLSQALRDNLFRRKQQARTRKQATTPAGTDVENQPETAQDTDTAK